MGRRPKPEGTARKLPVEVKVSQVDLEAIDAAAAAADKSRSTWCYEAIMARVARDARRAKK